jgi:transposase InsO family protein
MFDVLLGRRLSVVHPKAALTPRGRLILCQRIASGRAVAHVAEEMGVSRPTAHKWWRRFRLEGPLGLLDRSSRPHSSPTRTSPQLEHKVEQLRRSLKLGPVRLGARLGVPASTVHRILVRRGISRIAWMDRPTGQVIRRYERDRPGELIHVDVKKLGRIPLGGGHRWLGRTVGMAHRHANPAGYEYLHAAVDDHSRLAYVEIASDETGSTSAAFWRRASQFFSDHGITVERVLTDNALAYRRSLAFRAAVAEMGAVQRFIRPRRPQTNGKVERFNRTLLDEWAYVRFYRNNDDRASALPEYLHLYNHHRAHTALGLQAPISRVNNVPAHYS